ncbi:hypothetical protein GCM10023310_23300 [Paenibacillus vulneris]
MGESVEKPTELELWLIYSGEARRPIQQKTGRSGGRFFVIKREYFAVRK